MNSALRRGLGAEAASSRPYRLTVRQLGLKPGVDLDHAHRLAGDLEDVETLRKLELRK